MKYLVAPLLTVAAIGCSEESTQRHRQAQEKIAPSAADSSRAATAAKRDSPPQYHATVSSLTADVSELRSTVTDTQIILDLPADVLFDFDKADLKPKGISHLRKSVAVINEGGPGLITVEGHTDSIGTDAYNVDLSKRRAEAVARWLSEEGGVVASRLQPLARGESDPVAANTNSDGSDNPQGRQRNRRVTIYIPRR